MAATACDGCDHMDLDEQYPLPFPLPAKPLAKDVGEGKRFATRADYLAAKEAWQREDDSPARRAMRLARKNAQTSASRRTESSGPNASDARKKKRCNTASNSIGDAAGDGDASRGITGRSMDTGSDASDALNAGVADAADAQIEAEASDEPRRQRRRMQSFASGTAGLPVGARHSIDRMPRLAALRPIPDACRSVGHAVAGGHMGFPDKPSATDVRTFRELVRSDTVLLSSQTACRAKPVC